MFVRRNAASFLALSANGLVPSKRTLPDVGGSSVPRIESSVLFPEPLGPRMARFSPRRSEKVTPDNTRTGSAGVGYPFTILSTTSSAVADSFAIPAIPSVAGQFAKLCCDVIRNRDRHGFSAVRHAATYAGHFASRYVAALIRECEAIG